MYGLTVLSDFWSVKFYPYTQPGVDPVFAVAGGKRILVCRPPGKENPKMEVIQLIVDEDVGADHYACAWSKSLDETPLLCVSGGNGKIKIINALTGDLIRVLAGHGGEVNDLAVSPINPHILASASEDSTVRIWSLDPAHDAQPCAAILEGDGHRETVLSLSFHSSGRYLLSGGIDHLINLWVLPEFPDNNTGTSKPTRIYYPHFSTSEIHADIVDCVAWYGDLIFSKAAREHCIVLWSINGFAPTDPPPSPTSAPTTHDPNRDTRSAFSPPSSTAFYTRHLQFSIPESEIIFMRFSIFEGSKTSNPVLAFCNGVSKVFFWDLARFEEYHEVIDYFPGGTANPQIDKSASSGALDLRLPSASNPRNHPFLLPFQRRNRGGAVARLHREASPTESSSSHHTGSDNATDKGSDTGKGQIDWAKSRAQWEKKYEMGDPLKELEAHQMETVKGLGFMGRQVAWSNDGQWCVVVGSAGVIGILQRWEKK
ncbi:WD40 repeat-like protein [Hyaloscypha variabilis F]|uniref:WD40 repeat-like protein n=1 Tax=Hyaloscypha variabilis (strain UAMH 11265 / GT02V1 / F) TaxID=1149755 RepID=A0A2J6S9V6_HYAVF|nr:WD40 repeat-like protein [Hyaloscypha variabilis F]